jgi:DNA topoisomerase-1
VKGKGTGKGKCEAKVEITDSREIEKIKELKIPPAYENVTILNNKKIIAYGYDSKNRKQVLYHPSFVATQNIKKYNKISASIKFFSKLKKKVSEDLNGNGGGNEKTMAIAVIISLILSCGFRIGNKKYEKDNNSVGLTTLKYKHLAFKDNLVIIDFIGKKGVRNVAECDNKRIYDYLYHKQAVAMSNASDTKDIKDTYIFNYEGGKGNEQSERSERSERSEANKVISSSDVNEYLRVISDPYSIIITTKDLRTWNANMLFLTYYRKLQKLRKRTSKRREATDVAEAVAAVAAAAEAKTAKEVEKDIKKAIEMVAEKLHNSYSICKKSYIDPKIIDELLHKN